ncbi:fucose permease [Chitinophaga skermanii]|uniref:Fucose permease n=1 Tax=Chitinophaga skermanii TaxID=331697 RepID=A0A327Q781_9BACT|nr:MFS transporter [Chitinophaga skermanii]RAI99723.1 fucose permease [Chitinophaga skermanii]
MSDPLIRRQARLALSVFFFINGLCFASWASRIPAIQAHLHLSEAGLGSVLLAIPIGSAVSLPLAGWIITKFGSRPVMICAAILYASLLAVIGTTQTVFALVCTLFCFGMMGNLGNISTNTQAVGLEILYGRTIMSSFHAVWSLAGLAGAGIGMLMVNLHWEPMQHFFTVAAFSFLCILLTFKFTLQQSTQQTSKQPIFVMPGKPLITLGIIAFCCMICEGAMYEWSGVYFKKVVDSPPGLVTMGFTAFTFATTSGRITGDAVSLRLGVQKTLICSGLLSTLGLAISVIFPYIGTAMLGFFLVGLGVANIIPIVYSRAGKSTTMQPSMAIAAVTSLGFLGFLTGPPLIGFVAAAVNLRLSFAIIALMGLVIVWMTKRSIRN